MKTILIKILALIALVTSCAIGTLSFTPTFADDPVCNSSVPEEVKKAAGCPEYSTSDKLPSIIIIILNSVIGISSFIAVVFIIIGGVSYMTSAGDAGKLKKAKDTILYAVIGMIVCILAFAIVNWAIGVFNNTQTDEDETSSLQLLA